MYTCSLSAFCFFRIWEFLRNLPKKLRKAWFSARLFADYYKEVLRRANLDAADCLMVGNDVAEDMIAGAKAGLRGFLLTDCLINTPNADIEQYPHGSFDELDAYIETLLNDA